MGKYLLDRLHALGVAHIFGIPGDYVIRFNKAIEQHPIKFINATRENTAGYMADAYARVKGLGVACITYGVGINITNAVSQAWAESSPLVVISGAAGSHEMLRKEKLHHLIYKGSAEEYQNTQLEIFKQITIDQAILDTPELAAEAIDRVLGSCLKNQKPVYIELPRDSVDAPIPIPKPVQILKNKSDQDVLKEALNEASELLNQCQRPFLWLGHEIQRAGLAESVIALAEKHNIPIVTSLLGKSAISEFHPLFVGVYSGQISRPEVVEFVDHCDCALIFGVMMSDIDTGIFTAKLEHDAKIIANPSQVQVSRHHYHEIDWIDFVKGVSIKKKFTNTYPRAIDHRPESFKPRNHQKITTPRVFECIQSHLKPEHLVVTDIGDCLFGAADLVVEKNSFFACAYFATLGFCVPGTLGALFASPGKKVIGIVGDGAFQMTCTELATAVRYELDPVIILLNNHGYGTERPLLEGKYNDIHNWNYTELPKVFGGGRGIKVTTEIEMNEALKTALSVNEGFTLIEVDLEKTDFSLPMRRFLNLAKKTT